MIVKILSHFLKLSKMSKDTTFFVAIPMSELLELLEKMISASLENFIARFHHKPIEELMNIDEVCKYLRVSKVTIHKWKKNKLIKAYRIGRKIYFKKTELIMSFR